MVATLIVSKQVLRSLAYQRIIVNNDEERYPAEAINAVRCAYQVRNADWKKKRTGYLDL